MKTFSIVTFVFLLFADLLFIPNPFTFLSVDVGQFLEIGQLILSGKVPYVDFFEVNPPLIHYLHTVPVAISYILGVGSSDVFHVMVLLLIIFSAALLFQSMAKLSPRRRVLVLLSYYAISVLAILRSDFGQREHLFTIVFLPYLFCRALKEKEFSKSQLMLTLFCGLFSCLKPFFFLMLLTSEALLLSSKNKISRKTLLMLGAPMVAYAIYLIFFSAYLSQGLSMVATRYRVWGFPYNDWYQTFGYGYLILGTLTAGFPLILVSSGQGTTREKIVFLLTICGMIAFVGVLYANKGFSYHFIPAYGCLFMAIATYLEFEKNSWRARLKILLAGVLVLPFWTTACVVNAFYFPPRYDNPVSRLAQTMDKGVRADEGVLLLSYIYMPNYFVQRKIRNCTRYEYAPFYFHGSHPFYPAIDKLAAWERLFIENMRSDIKSFSPEFIIMTKGKKYFAAQVDVYEYASHYLLQPEVLQHYPTLLENNEEVILVRADRLSEAKARLGL